MPARRKSMVVTRTIIVKERIWQCKFSCPYYSDVGHDMRCEHPLAPNGGYIIKPPRCLNGFPVRCPEVKARKAKAS